MLWFKKKLLNYHDNQGRALAIFANYARLLLDKAIFQTTLATPTPRRFSIVEQYTNIEAQADWEDK